MGRSLTQRSGKEIFRHSYLKIGRELFYYTYNSVFTGPCRYQNFVF